jgi:hypothetical protein
MSGSIPIFRLLEKAWRQEALSGQSCEATLTRQMTIPLLLVLTRAANVVQAMNGACVRQTVILAIRVYSICPAFKAWRLNNQSVTAIRNQAGNQAGMTSFRW